MTCNTIKTKGYTLIELMVALALGLMLVLLAYGFTMNLNRSQIQARSSQMLQTQARYLFDVLGFHLQAAGYYDPMRRTDAGSRYYLNYAAITLNESVAGSSSANNALNRFLSTLPTDASKILPIQVVPTTGNRSALPAKVYNPPLHDYITCDGLTMRDYAEAHALINVFWVKDNQLHCRSLLQKQRRIAGQKNSPWQLADPKGDNILIAKGVADLTIKLAKEKTTSNGPAMWFAKVPTEFTAKKKYGKSAKGIHITLKLYMPNQASLTAAQPNPNDWQSFQSFFQFRNRYH